MFHQCSCNTVMSHIKVYEACDDFEPVVERLNGFLEQVAIFLQTSTKVNRLSKSIWINLFSTTRS